ncbi:hypothetical protein G6F40_016879 [Rhizopus arrhizus]|nr:hypothetical protein G6F40_016879 [Rhizopus arrhizus]
MLAALEQRGRGCEAADHEINPAAGQVVQRMRHALVGHVRERRLLAPGQDFAGHLVDRTQARAAVGQLARLLAANGQQVGHGLVG